MRSSEILPAKLFKFYIRFVLDHPSRLHVGIVEFKVLNGIPVLNRPKQINLCQVGYMGRRLSILKWNFPWLVSGIPSPPDMCNTMCYHM